MKGLVTRFFAVSLGAALLLVAGSATADVDFLPIDIQVSPNVLNIQSEGDVVSVHTDIPYGQVVSATVTLNMVPINWSKADNQGNFVAKFLMSEVKALVPDYLTVGIQNELTLMGLTTGGFVFAGTDQMLVVDNLPRSGR
jgi:hypothetical protein